MSLEKSILTYKIRHEKDFATELAKAFKVAEFAVRNKSIKNLTSASVKHIGLPSAISNQILRKYGNNKTIKKVRSVKLIAPGQAIKLKDGIIYISCLKLEVNFSYQKDLIVKINQIELDNEYAYVSCEVKPRYKQHDLSNNSDLFIGVDRNASSHIAVCAIGKKIMKLGKIAGHIQRKYNAIRRKAQKRKKYKFVKKLGNKQARRARDLNHKISKKIVSEALKNGFGIKLENLKGLKNKKDKSRNRKLNGIISSWSYYQLAQFIEYKAKLYGVQVRYVDPAFTSQICSKCGLIGNRDKKMFVCDNKKCRHRDHADANASFNISKATALDVVSKKPASNQASLPSVV